MKFKTEIYRSYRSQEVWNRILTYWSNFNGNLDTAGFLEFKAKNQGELHEGFEFVALNTAMSKIHGIISIYKPDEGEIKFQFLDYNRRPYRIYHYQIISTNGDEGCRIRLTFEIKTKNPLKLGVMSFTKNFWLKPMIASIGG